MIEDDRTALRLACDRCHELEARGGSVPDWARAFWERHKEDDARQLAQSEKRRREMEIRRSAIAKLTPAERAELGV